MSNWVAIDWGTSNFRAYLLNGKKVIDQVISNDGMKNIKKNNFEKTLIKNISKWFVKNNKLEVWACGMVGSKQGWIEVPYVQAPCKIYDVNFLKPKILDDRFTLSILSGVSQMLPEDIMRGEETLIAGYLLTKKNFDGSICIPGTHSKWINVKKAKILNFSTFLTGELFDLLSYQSILKFSITDNKFSKDKFIEGINEVFHNPQKFTNQLFQLRAKHLLKNQKSIHTNSLLSGYIVGIELLGSKDYWYKKDLILIGSKFMNSCYKLALNNKVNSIKILDSTNILIKGLSYFKNKL